MSLTNLDQPLFDGAGATKRDLVDYLDGVRDRIIPELEDRPLSVIRVHRGAEAFMQKNVPKYAPSWVAHGAVVGGDLEAGRVLRAVQRPSHPAVVRQSARRGVSPDAGTGRPSGPRDPSCARPRPARRRRFPDGGPGGPSGPPRPGRRRPGRCGQDEWGQGRARLRPDRRRRRRRRTRPPRREPSRREPRRSIRRSPRRRS